MNYSFKLLIVVFMICFNTFVFADKPGKYNSEAIAISKEVKCLLIDNKYCEVQYTKDGYEFNDCSFKKIFFTTGSDNKIVASFYQITDKKIIAQIKSIYMNFYLKNKKNVGISVKFYKGTHKEEAERFFGLFSKPFYKFELKGE